MDKMVKYIDLYWPVEYCNFNCPYCYVHQHMENKGHARYHCSHSAAEIRAALSKERLGGVCLLNICAGGETLLEDEIVPIIRELLIEGHYVGIVTNGMVRNNIEKFADFPMNLRKRLFFKFSFHYGELKRRDKLDDFFSIVNFVRNFGASFSLELPGWDGFIPENSQIIEMCKENVGAAPHVTTLRDETKSGFTLMSRFTYDELNTIWNVYDSKLYQVRAEIMKNKYKGFCYAGSWTLTANLESGEIRQCYYERIIGNLYNGERLNLCPVGNHCHSEYCYACHAFLTLGDIPSLQNLVYYDETRNRENAGWLNQEMLEFMHQKLYETNREFNFLEKKIANEKNRKYELSQYQSADDFSRKTIIAMKNQPVKENYALVEAKHSANLIYGTKTLPSELLWLDHIYHGRHLLEQTQNVSPITITALGEKSSDSQGDEIWLVGLLAGNVWYDANDIFEHRWLTRNRMLGWRSWDNESIPYSICGNTPPHLSKGQNIILVMEMNKWRGVCKITFNDHETIVDTYGSSDDDIIFISIT